MVNFKIAGKIRKPVTAEVVKPLTLMHYVVADFEKATMQILSDKDAQTADADVLIPMVGADQIDLMPKHLHRTFEQQLSLLVQAIEDGRCPVVPEVEEWLNSIFGTEEPEGPIEGGSEEGKTQDFGDDFPEVQGDHAEMYRAGFAAGVQFALTQQLFQTAQNIINVPNEPNPPVEIPVDRKQALLGALTRQRGARK